MAKTTQWLNGSFPEVVAASVQIYCMYPAKYLCQSDEWHTKSVTSNVLAFRRSLLNLPLFCHTEVMSPRKSTESGRTMFWCFMVMTSIASALLHSNKHSRLVCRSKVSKLTLQCTCWFLQCTSVGSHNGDR